MPFKCTKKHIDITQEIITIIYYNNKEFKII